MYIIIVGKLIALLAQSATATAGLRAPKDNFDAKRIPIVSAKPIEKAPYIWDAVNKITAIKKNVANNSPIKLPKSDIILYIYKNII